MTRLSETFSFKRKGKNPGEQLEGFTCASPAPIWAIHGLPGRTHTSQLGCSLKEALISYGERYLENLSSLNYANT